MANSDNVLRCGLTPKHVDVPELLKITDFRELAEPRWPATGDEVRSEFRVPVPDFALSVLAVTAGGSRSGRLGGPAIALCTSGRARIAAGGVQVPLEPGQAAFVAAGEFTVAGEGTVFVATVGSTA